jgi:hypothetical protein
MVDTLINKRYLIWAFLAFSTSGASFDNRCTVVPTGWPLPPLWVFSVATIFARPACVARNPGMPLRERKKAKHIGLDPL